MQTYCIILAAGKSKRFSGNNNKLFSNIYGAPLIFFTLTNILRVFNKDEVFIVIEGSMNIEFENETVQLNEGEMLVVPKGIEHKPYAESECKVMLVEPRGVVNTGDADSELKADNDVWI